MEILKNKKLLIALICLMAATVAVSVLTCTAIVTERTRAIRHEMDSLIDLLTAAQNERNYHFGTVYKEDSPMYILCEYNGQIGIYDSQKGGLVEVLDQYIYALPETDRQLLKKGIPVYSFNELLSLIEDYTS